MLPCWTLRSVISTDGVRYCSMYTWTVSTDQARSLLQRETYNWYLTIVPIAVCDHRLHKRRLQSLVSISRQPLSCWNG
jgi:hypothetical protein